MPLQKNDLELKIGINPGDSNKSLKDLSDYIVRVAKQADASGGGKLFDTISKNSKTASIAVEDLTKKLRSADFTVISDLEKKLRGADFGNKISDTAANATKAIGLTRQEALALTYTFNDITASLASGSSPFTILFQQGGQLTQAFGGVTNTFKALLPYVLRFGPAIAAAAAAGGAFYGLKIGADAAESLAKLADQADKAKLSVQSLQKLTAAGAVSGVPADEVASGLKRVSDEALKAAVAQSDLSTKIQEVSRKAAFGVAGAAQELAKLKAQQPDNIFAKLGVSLNGFTGRVEDSLPAIKRLADRLASLPAGLRRDQLIAQAEATFGEGLTKVLLKGSAGIEEYSAKLDNLVPPLKKAQTEAAKAQQELSGLYAEATKRASEQTGAAFIPASLEATKFLLDTIRGNKPLVVDFANAVAEFFRVLNGDTQAEQRNPALTELVGILTAAKGLLSDLAGLGLGGLNAAFSELYKLVDGLVAKFNEAFGTNFTTNTTLAIGALGLLAAAFGPVGLAIAGVSAALLVLKENWDALKSATQGFGAGIDASGGSGNSGYASGGYVAGPGTGTSDSIPAWLSNGEFVIRSAAVRRFGVDFFRQLNGLSLNPSAFGGRFGFASGGLVGAPSGVAMAGGTGGRSFNLVIDGRSFNGLSGQTDTIASLEKYASLRQLSATSKRAPSRIG